MVPLFVSEETPLLVSILLFLPIIFLILKRKSSKVPPLPPGPRPWPIIGNLPSMDNKPHQSLTRLAQTYGPLISLRLGSQLVVVGSSPEAATEILKTHDRLLSGRYVPHASYARRPDQSHTSFWTDCTDQWKLLRTLCRSELFGPKMIEAQSVLREKKVQEMVEYLCSKEDQPVQISQVVFASVFNVLGQLFFTRDFIGFNEGKESESMSKLMREIMELWAAPNISDFYPIVGGLDLQGLSRKSDVCVGKICGAWQNIIEERRENKGINAERHKDFLDVLLDNEFSDDQINHLFLELFAAGSDTSTSTVVWAMAELIKNPEAMDKICKEVTSHVSQSAIKESDLAHLPYLQACLKETLRLHPPAPLLLPHRAIQDCHVMNYTIPKGTQVLVNSWPISRDPKIWENPSSFKPERFMGSNLDFKGNDFEFLPFGSGRRICPGLPLATRQVQLVLATLIHNFEWLLPENMTVQQLDMNEKFGVTLEKEQPLVLVPKCKQMI